MRHDQLDTVIARVSRGIMAHQRTDGSFRFYCECQPFADAMMIVFLKLQDVSSNAISQFAENIRARQHRNGSWRVHPALRAERNSITVLSYFALLLAGDSREDPHMRRAEAFIRQHGGLSSVSMIVKIILAISGQIPWSKLPSEHLELALFQPSDPISLYDLSTAARLHIPSIMILSYFKYSVHLDARYSLKHLESRQFHVPWQHPLLNPIATRAIDECRTYLVRHVEENGTLASYFSATFLMVFALQAMENPEDAKILKRAISGIISLQYETLSGHVYQQLFPSTVWDTCLSIQALCAAGCSLSTPELQRAISYVRDRQHTHVSDWIYHAPRAKPGGFAFSDVNARVPDMDDTAEALIALRLFGGEHREAAGRAQAFLMEMQNDDGGWSAFDRNCNKFLVDAIGSHGLHLELTDPSSADLTGHVLQALDANVQKDSVKRGIRYLRRTQELDGSWFGRYGITFLYGTSAALEGLRSCGIRPDDAMVIRALEWLEGCQHPDGGFGESPESEYEGCYQPLLKSSIVQTSWALLGMMAATTGATPAIQKAASYLVDALHQTPKEAVPSGVALKGQLYLSYHSYPYVWPLLALCRYRNLTR